MKGRSTATALVNLVEHIIDKLEEGCNVASLFLDFTKAFDCLNHHCLIRKLAALGITDNPSSWFYSYLSDRKQLVELQFTRNNTIEKAQSQLHRIQRGVPQGSVLGPVLFLLLTNDLPTYLQGICQTIMYADDTVITLAEKTKEELITKIEDAFAMTKDYCVPNNLVLNEEKTVKMAFTTRGQNTEGETNNFKYQSTTKYLGILIDSKLSWKPHIDQLCKKLSSGIYLIRRLKQISNTEHTRTAYFAFMESHMRYGIMSWGGTTCTNLERVLVTQKRAIRCLAGLGFRESCRAAFVELRILTVVALYIQETIMYAVSTKQPRHQNFHQHNTRRATDFALPAHSTNLFKRKPTYIGAKLYNELPNELKQTPANQLKKRLSEWLLTRPFYTLEEYMTKAL